jgi:hypothetical protein
MCWLAAMSIAAGCHVVGKFRAVAVVWQEHSLLFSISRELLLNNITPSSSSEHYNTIFYFTTSE